tara:strand:- start:923 stop:1948 length:1026 start_codon:yes stop_codon:yes gene_type:complete
MNYKLIIGLVVSGVFLFLLYMNYSSVENSIFHPTLLMGPPGHADITYSYIDPPGSSNRVTTTIATPEEVTAAAARINGMVGKNLLVVDKSTGNIVQLDNDTSDAHSAVDAKTRFDNIIDYIANHTGDHGGGAYTNNAVAQGIITSLGSPSGPVAKLNAYKDLIGPGLYTVLGMPKKADDGDGIGTNLTNPDIAAGGYATRRAYGSHGILGDMYRYVRPRSNTDPLASWARVGGWRSTGSIQEPRDYNSWRTSRGMGVGSHATDASDRSWERVKLLTDEMHIKKHHGRYTLGNLAPNQGGVNGCCGDMHTLDSQGTAPRPGVADESALHSWSNDYTHVLADR